MACVEGAVDYGEEIGVEVFGAGKGVQVVFAVEVIVGTDRSLSTVAGTLQPAVVLAATTCADKIDGDELVAIHGCGNVGAIAKSLGTETVAHWRV